LIGNTLVALAERPALREATRTPDTLRAVTREVSRHDAPVQNTRRFLAEAAEIAGHALRPGDGVLVVLGAANRDPAANANPEAFDLDRSARRCFTFGAGVHACPGEDLAVAIATEGVRWLLGSGIQAEALVRNRRYRPLANVRSPVFGTWGS
jgi:cytochrome P450